MRSWEVTTSATYSAQAVMSELVLQMGASAFGETLLTRLNHLLPAGSFSLYRVWRDQSPVLLMSHSLQPLDVTRRCFAAYRNKLYLEDRSFDEVRARHEDASCLLMHIRADEFKNPEHREQIYVRNHVRERLSVAQSTGDGSVLSLNIYAHDGHSSYTDRHLGRFESVAHVLFAGAQRHLALIGAPVQSRQLCAADADLDRLFLSGLDKGLTTREIDVCACLLQGMTYDGIARQLDLSRATVITYRNRAFARLGINFKNQLFAQRARYQGSQP